MHRLHDYVGRIGPDDFDLNLLRVLDAVLAERSVTRAADRLHLSQPAVSHALARLRRSLGDPLIERRGRSMELTVEGERLARHVREVLRHVKTEITRGELELSTTTRRFVIALPDVLVGRLAPPLLRRLRQEAPEAGLELQRLSAHTDVAMVEHQVDAAIGYAGSWRPPLRSSFLFAVAWQPVVACTNDEVGERASLDELAALPHVDISDVVVNGLVDAALGAHGLERRVALVLGSGALMADVLPGTSFVGFLPAGHPLDPRLRWLPIDVDIAVVSYQLWWGHQSENDPASAWFRTVIRDVARQAPHPA